jgi:Sigma-70, region 4
LITVSSRSCRGPLRALPERQRVAVVLVHGLGYPVSEVAELLSIKPTTVRNTSNAACAASADPWEPITMPDNLNNQLRALVGATAAVTAREAVARAEAHLGASGADSVTRRRGHLGRSAAVAASAVVIAGAGIGWTAVSTSSPMHAAARVTARQHQPKAILTAAEVRAITAHSTAAVASSGQPVGQRGGELRDGPHHSNGDTGDEIRQA